jgi:hypothetical protein
MLAIFKIHFTTEGAGCGSGDLFTSARPKVLLVYPAFLATLVTAFNLGCKVGQARFFG